MLKPNEEQRKKIIAYLEHLNMYRTEPQDVDEYTIVELAELWIRLIDKFGDGDPIKAAQNQAMMMVGIREDIANGKLDPKDYHPHLSEGLENGTDNP